MVLQPSDYLTRIPFDTIMQALVVLLRDFLLDQQSLRSMVYWTGDTHMCCLGAEADDHGIEYLTYRTQANWLNPTANMTNIPWKHSCRCVI